MEPRELFARMPGAFKPEKAVGVNAVIQVTLTGDGGGVWTVTIADGQCTVVEAPAEASTMTLVMSATDYAALIDGRLSPMSAFFMGKIKFQGDMALAMKFQSMFG